VLDVEDRELLQCTPESTTTAIIYSLVVTKAEHSPFKVYDEVTPASDDCCAQRYYLKYDRGLLIRLCRNVSPISPCIAHPIGLLMSFTYVHAYKYLG
jgi:hypothetical protein